MWLEDTGQAFTQNTSESRLPLCPLGLIPSDQPGFLSGAIFKVSQGQERVTKMQSICMPSFLLITITLILFIIVIMCVCMQRCSVSVDLHVPWHVCGGHQKVLPTFRMALPIPNKLIKKTERGVLSGWSLS